MLTKLAACLVLALAAPASAEFASAPHQIKMEEPAPTRAEVRAALAKRRDHNLASFRLYAKAGIYPHNFVRPGPLQTWLDRDGHLCAAATIINMDGQKELVAQTAKTNNNIRLLDVTDGALMDWMLTSGFTIEEIDRIQEPGFNERTWRKEQEEEERKFFAREDVRLHKVYAETDAYLVKHVKDGLDTATDRLMEHPDLARALLSSSGEPGNARS